MPAADHDANIYRTSGREESLDRLDENLLAAWTRILPRLRDDPHELERRLSRMRGPMHRRPLRAWCLCLRASDTRIVQDATARFDESAAAHCEPHDVTLTGPGLRKLMAPFQFGRDALRWTEVARRLGMHEEALRSWIQCGVFEEVEHAYCRSMGYHGKPCPMLWHSRPLDPNAVLGRRPDPLWGSLWQSRHERIPDDYQVTLRRVPRFISYRGERRFRGWDWLCPTLAGSLRGPGIGAHGKASSSARHRGIGPHHTAPRLYLPLPVWTLPRQFGPESLRQVLRDASDRLDPLFKRLHVTRFDRFACQHCWRVRYTNYAYPGEAWNQFVTHFSGGLLHGREVTKPADFLYTRPLRFRRYTPHLNRPPSRRRQQVLKLLLTTKKTYRQMADHLGVGYGTVHIHVKELYRQHNVHGRNALARSLGRKPPLHVELDRTDQTTVRGTRLDARVARRRAQVARLLPLGLTHQQLATHLHTTMDAIHHDITYLRRKGMLPRPNRAHHRSPGVTARGPRILQPRPPRLDLTRFA